MGSDGESTGISKYPLPDPIRDLRTSIYPHRVQLPIGGTRAMGIDARFPTTHAEYIRRCHEAGQNKPTPLILKYGTDDYNCLHQDSMASMFSRYRSLCCCRNPRKTSKAASL